MHDRLVLEGRLQIETARHALEVSGKDIAIERTLGIMLMTHSAADPQSRLSVNISGDAAISAKENLIGSLIEIEKSPSTNSSTLALTQGLLSKLLSEAEQ